MELREEVELLERKLKLLKELEQLKSTKPKVLLTPIVRYPINTLEPLHAS